jgi:hypothetical protein
VLARDSALKGKKKNSEKRDPNAGIEINSRYQLVEPRERDTSSGDSEVFLATAKKSTERRRPARVSGRHFARTPHERTHNGRHDHLRLRGSPHGAHRPPRVRTPPRVSIARRAEPRKRG